MKTVRSKSQPSMSTCTFLTEQVQEPSHRAAGVPPRPGPMVPGLPPFSLNEGDTVPGQGMALSSSASQMGSLGGGHDGASQKRGRLESMRGGPWCGGGETPRLPAKRCGRRPTDWIPSLNSREGGRVTLRSSPDIRARCLANVGDTGQSPGHQHPEPPYRLRKTPSPCGLRGLRA